MITAGVVGGTGYVGAELLRLLAIHPSVTLGSVTSRGQAGTPIADVFPNLRHFVSQNFVLPEADSFAGCDVVFFATPNGTAMKLAPELLERGLRVIDLSADYRLQDPAVWEQWYGVAHASPELLGEAVYGLPEVNRDAIAEARLIANPGCYATSVQLGFLPLIEAGVVDSGGLIADTKSGVSGAGRTPGVPILLCEASENFNAYAASGHRHMPEICQGLEAATGQSIGLTFVPHLVPMNRGIHATLYATLEDGDTDIETIFKNRYEGEHFVDLLPPGSHPQTRSVRGTNRCQISWHRPQGGNRLVVLSVIDNLGKGAAGQAIQNMNILFALEEQTGLDQPALLP